MQRAASTLLLLGLCAPAAPAQDLAQAVADLSHPERAVAACSYLRQRGVHAVQPLRQLLQQSRGADADAAGLCMALYVLGSLGPQAVTALPEVEQVYHDCGPTAVRNQALWALGELALASGDVQTCMEAAKLVDFQWTQDLDATLGRVVVYRLRLGPRPDALQLLAKLKRWSPYWLDALAAARAVTAGQTPAAPLRQRLWELLYPAVQDAFLPTTMQAPWGDATGDLAVALADRCGLGREPIVLRGLLRAWDPDRRRVALAQLIEHPELAAIDIADVAPLLFDPYRDVRMQAARTLRSLQAAGLPGLLGLRIAQAAGADSEFQAACGEAAAAICLSVRSQLTGKLAPALLAELDGIASGRPPEVDQPAFDAEATRLWAGFTVGARLCPAGTAAVLLRLGVQRGATGEDAIIAGVCAMYRGDAELQLLGMQFLARQGPLAAEVLPLDTLLFGIAALNYRLLATAFECKAWVEAGPKASIEQLHRALAQGMTRVRLRAVTELAARGALPDPGLLAGLPARTEADRCGLVDPFRGDMPQEDASLTEVHTLMLGLCGVHSDSATFRQLAADWFEVPQAQVPSWLAEVQRSGQVGSRLLELEAVLRNRLKVDARVLPQ